LVVDGVAVVVATHGGRVGGVCRCFSTAAAPAAAQAAVGLNSTDCRHGWPFQKLRRSTPHGWPHGAARPRAEVPRRPVAATSPSLSRCPRPRRPRRGQPGTLRKHPGALFSFFFFIFTFQQKNTILCIRRIILLNCVLGPRQPQAPPAAAAPAPAAPAAGSQVRCASIQTLYLLSF
jgi:hypothetical protein